MRQTQAETKYGFEWATGDINYLDYGATWIRQTGEREFHLVRLINWEDSCGEREAKEVGFKYNMSLSIVDLAEIPVDQQKQALESCGNESETDDRWIALMCFEYGLHAPIADLNTNNFHKTFRNLAARSRELTAKDWLKREALERPVNRIGSTAAEFMRGDIKSALDRMEDGPVARILRKMEGR